jgi:ATP-dependent DNA helicase RecG
MKSIEIQEFLNLGEGPRLEFKSNLKSFDGIGRVVSGFLNTTGGFVICGIGRDNEVLGVEVRDEQLAAFERRLHESISPKTLISIERQILTGKQVIVIEVPKGHDVPYSFRNVIYLRNGEQTEPADGATIRDMVLMMQIAPERWERRISLADIETEVATEEVMATVRDAQSVQRAFFADPTDVIRTLENLSAAKYGRLTNGGDVLFSKNPAARLPQIRIRAMRYNSDKAGDKFSDMKSFEGPLKSIFEEAYTFIVRNTPSISRFIKGNPKRQDSPLYPEGAVREALINALAHRDYSAASGGVSIHVFPRRLEIWNSGALPDGVTEESLLLGHISVLRNPDIAHALYLRGLMEKAGRGSVLMVQQCADAGLPRPFWKSDPKLGVTVTFPAPEVTQQETQQVTPDVGHQVGTKLALSQHQVEILRKCLTESTIGELMAVAGRSDRTKFRNQVLKPLLDARWVEMTIPDKPKSSNQRYRLTALGKTVLAQPNP